MLVWVRYDVEQGERDAQLERTLADRPSEQFFSLLDPVANRVLMYPEAVRRAAMARSFLQKDLERRNQSIGRGVGSDESSQLAFHKGARLLHIGRCHRAESNPPIASYAAWRPSRQGRHPPRVERLAMAVTEAGDAMRWLSKGKPCSWTKTRVHLRFIQYLILEP